MPSGAQAPSQGNPGGGQQVELTCSVLRSAHTEPSLCAQPSWLHSHARAGQLGAGVTIRADGGDLMHLIILKVLWYWAES